MVVLFVTWLAFKIPMQGGSPPVLDQLLAVIGGLWFGNLVRVQGTKEAEETPKALPESKKSDDDGSGRVQTPPGES